MVPLQQKIAENIRRPVHFIASNTDYLGLIIGGRKFGMDAT